MALNSDGAAKGKSIEAGGCRRLRDYKCEWLVGFTENLGNCSSMKAEIRVVLRGIKIARELEIPKLWVQLDSKVLVRMI